ncbi:MAG TPA: protein phosphatase 2C domain-containing protein [Ktedonobacterales bacterium]|nr:protein phosphatase 2C domain-containing protein [Ktedonobacterales bacterium]
MQDSLNLALLTLGGWLLLSLLLVTPLVVMSFFQRRAAARPEKMPSRFPRSPVSREEEEGGLCAAEDDTLQAVLPAWSQPGRVAAQPTPRLVSSVAYPTRRRETQKLVEAQPCRPLGMQVGAHTDGGRLPEMQENEDSFLTVTGARKWAGRLHPFGLFVVVDGVGGNANGHEASRKTMLAISQRFVPALTQSEVSDNDLTLLLAASIRSANSELYLHNQSHARPLGCTITAALITDQQISICHVGKNRAYLLAEELPIRRVTTDHSLVESLVVAGFIQRDDVYTHPRRNRIYRCLGQGPQVEVDTVRLPPVAGARLLFCSDGLWEVLRDSTMEDVLREYADVSEASSQLVTLAKERGGLDDITAVLVKLTDQPEPARRPGIRQIASSHAQLAL